MAKSAQEQLAEKQLQRIKEREKLEKEWRKSNKKEEDRRKESEKLDQKGWST